MLRYPSAYVYQNQAPSGTLNCVGASGTVIAAGLALDSGLCASDSLAALVTLAPVTSTLTMACQWQVNDAGTWINCPTSNGAQPVVLASASSNSPVNVLIPAPAGLTAGSRQVRMSIVGGGTTAVTVTDTCSISYEFRAPVTIMG